MNFLIYFNQSQGFCLCFVWGEAAKGRTDVKKQVADTFYRLLLTEEPAGLVFASVSHGEIVWGGVNPYELNASFNFIVLSLSLSLSRATRGGSQVDTAADPHTPDAGVLVNMVAAPEQLPATETCFSHSFPNILVISC